MSDLYQLNEQLIAASRALDGSLKFLEDSVADFATAERAYRKAKAEAYLRSSGKNVQEREANAEECRFGDETLGDIRYRRDLAEGLKMAALEGVRSRRTQLSAIQTLASLSKAEAEFARTGP